MAGDGDLDLGALRELLAASRRRGLPFEWAWRDACAALLPSDEPDQMSGRVLSGTREVWRACYERAPAQRGERGLGALAALLEDQDAASDPESGRSALLG